MQKALRLLNSGRILFIVVYTGYQEKQKESDVIGAYVQQLHHRDYNVAKFCMINKKQAPYVVEIEKR